MESKDKAAVRLPRLKRIGLNLLALCIGVAIFLIVGEIVTRIIYPKGIPEVFPPIFVSKKDVGYGLKPNYSGVHIHRDFRVIYSMNSSGFRDVNHSISKPKGTYRILVLGDSFTFGVGVKMEDTYPKVLERLLNERDTTRHYEVINMGVPGYATDQEYNLYRTEGIAYKPDMVIIGFFGMNDVDGVETGWQQYSAPNGYIVQAGRQGIKSHTGKIKGFLLKHSKFALIIDYKLTKLIDAYKRHGKKAQIPYQIYHDTYTSAFTEALNKAKNYLLDMSKLANNEDEKMILLLIPFEMEASNRNWVKYRLEDAYSDKVFKNNMLKSSKIFTEFGKEDKIATLDLIAVFRKDDPESCYFPYEAHWNRKGHELAGETLYRFIENNHLIQ